VEVLEEVGKPQPEPQALAIELGQRHEEVGHRVVFAAEEIGEAAGRFASVVHGPIGSRVCAASPHARSRILTRFRAHPSWNPIEIIPGAPAAAARIEKSLHYTTDEPERKHSDFESSEFVDISSLSVNLPIFMTPIRGPTEILPPGPVPGRSRTDFSDAQARNPERNEGRGKAGASRATVHARKAGAP
jgi:hypothetical protein